VVQKYTPEEVERISGIDTNMLIEAARTYAKADRSMIAYAMGVTQHCNGTDLVKSLANLAMITGNVGKESTGVNPLRGQCNVQGACDAGCLPNFYPGYQKVDDDVATDKFQGAWKRELSRNVGSTITRTMEKIESGEIKGLIIFGENVMVSDPDTAHIEKALKSLDFFAIVEIFPSETSKFADVILPAACYAEKDGTFTNTDRKIRMLRKAVDPPGEAMPDWKIVCELGKRFGADGFEFSSPSEIMDEMASVAPIYGGVNHERANNEVISWPCPTKDHPGTKVLHVDGFKMGRGKFAPVDHSPPNEEPSEEFPMVLTTGRNLFQFHTGTMTRKSPKLEQEAPEPYVEINNGDAKRLGIEDGSRVRVSSRRGSIALIAKVTEKIIPGTIFIPFHYAEAAANRLTNPAWDPVAQIPELKVCAARIEKS